MDKVYTSRGSYLEGHFLKISDPNGEIISRDPGNLDREPIVVPFSFEHVHEAVAAARRAYSSWRRLKTSDRLAALQRYRDLIKQRQEELAHCITREVGKPLWEAREEVEATLSVLDYFMREGSQVAVETQIANAATESSGVVRYFSRGVMAVLAPSNLPVYISHMHFVPALVHGNTVVLKSPKYAPLTGQCLAELIHDAGLPAGVVNVIQGDSEVARRLTSHPDVNGVFFTGSFETGSKIKKQALSDYDKVLVLEMGGQNGIVLWEDAHYEMALQESLLSAFLTTGQRCTSAGRLLVHDKIFDRFVEDFHQLAKKCRIGYGFNHGADEPFMGPLVSEAAMENYLQYQGMAVREGCEEVMRGKTLDRPTKGYYVSPSIHVVGTPNPKSVYQKGEISGPDVAIYRVRDLEEVTEILNQTQYGLVASIYTSAREHYMQLVEEVRVGLLHWNRPTYDYTHRLPHGGVKKSGNARPMGSFAAYQCTYPVSSLERNKPFQASDLPKQMPRWER